LIYLNHPKLHDNLFLFSNAFLKNFHLKNNFRLLSFPKREYVTLKIFDILGREVATLVDGEMEAGEHSVNFNAEWIPSSIYFAQMKAGDVVQRIKMELTK